MFGQLKKMVLMEFCYKQLWYLVGQGLLFNRNWWKLLSKRWWLNYNHFKIFLSWWRQNWKKLKMTSPHIREPDYSHYYYSIVNWIVVFKLHMPYCNGAQCQTSGTIHLIWRTESKTYNDEGFWNLSTEFTLNFMFELFFLVPLYMCECFSSESFTKHG